MVRDRLCGRVQRDVSRRGGSGYGFAGIGRVGKAATLIPVDGRAYIERARARARVPDPDKNKRLRVRRRAKRRIRTRREKRRRS